MRVTKESYRMTVDKFKTASFKDYTTMYQNSYLYISLHKLSKVLIGVCSTRLKEINMLDQYFPGLENKPFSEGNLIEILVNLVPKSK